MKRSMRYPYTMVFLLLLAWDWMIGVLCASGILSKWVFLLFNIPFGGLYVWMESSWTGSYYEMLGQRVGDLGSLIIFVFIVINQSILYTIILQQVFPTMFHTENLSRTRDRRHHH